MNAKPTYNVMERLLHRLALGSTLAKEVAFDLERWLFLDDNFNTASDDSPVYVCGLARSGTTILMQTLAHTGQFAAATYRSMPFVMAPNLWQSFSGIQHRDARPVERSHGDGLQISFDSPEAFEEVFWSTYCRITTEFGTYRASEPTDEVLKYFADYRRLVVMAASAGKACPTKQRYLSKNNNNLLRLRSLCAEPAAKIIIAYREPLATALSLHGMHQRYKALVQADPFIEHYMKWLGHHEFGPTRLPLDIALPNMNKGLAPETEDYWLDYWIAIHEHLIRQSNLPLLLIDHDTLREDPRSAIGALHSALDIAGDPEPMASKILPAADLTPDATRFNTALVSRAQDRYRTLKDSCLNLCH